MVKANLSKQFVQKNLAKRSRSPWVLLAHQLVRPTNVTALVGNLKSFQLFPHRCWATVITSFHALVCLEPFFHILDKTTTTNGRNRTVSANSSWFVNYRSRATSKWRTDLPRTRHMTHLSMPVDDFGYRPHYLKGSRSATFLCLFSKGTVDLPSPRWNTSRTYPPLRAV